MPSPRGSTAGADLVSGHCRRFLGLLSDNAPALIDRRRLYGPEKGKSANSLVDLGTESESRVLATDEPAGGTSTASRHLLRRRLKKRSAALPEPPPAVRQRHPQEELWQR